jgi:hypothetical protein
MSPMVQFDPATLAIWTTTGLLTQPTADYARAAMNAAMWGEDPGQAIADLPVNDPLRLRLLWLASSVWHEKRHFFDTCLTNYGARRFRDLFSLAGNFVALLADVSKRGEPVWFPVEVYGNKVRRNVLGILDPPPSVMEMARLARSLKRLTAQLDAPVGDGTRVIHVGAEAQLEGLAQTSQIHAIEHRYGLDEMAGVTSEYVHRLPLEGPYRAIEVISIMVGCSTQTPGGRTVVNSALAGALFVTALCGRFYGVGSQPEREFISPWPRLARLLEELGPKPGWFHMSDEEAWALVDAAARRLWGRGAIEEIAADIDASEAKFASAKWVADDSLSKAFADFIDLRRRLLAAIQTAGPASLLPRAFPSQWVDRLLPWHIVATPSGDSARDEGQGQVAFGINLKLPPELAGVYPSQTVWGRIQTAPPNGVPRPDFGLREHAAWLEMLQTNGPAAHLMLNGRRHRRMVPPELEGPIDRIKKLNIAVRFDPYFEWPEQRSNAIRQAEAAELANFSDRSHFSCDVTGDTIKASQAAVLTPWELRRSPLVQQVRKAGIFANLMLETNWADWVVRRDLLESQ